MENILDYNPLKLKEWMEINKENGFRAKQVIDWAYKGAISFDDMKNIPISLREKLKIHFNIGTPKVLKVLKSKTDDTYKFLFQYEDGNFIESVVMKYNHGNTICVSSQVGCRMGCKFCASTLDGMVRNLTAGEIIGQIVKAQTEIGERISNVVIMGSGEPFDNYDNIISFLQLVNSEFGLNIGYRHITLSTCGIVPKIIELANLNYQITLAISLHAPEDELRKTMMPIANKYSINEILDACKYYIKVTNRRITFEYAMVKGVNDSENEANELKKLLKGMLCHVNLIPVNEILENTFRKSLPESIKKFCNILESASIETTIRREMGADINAACGQLRKNYISSESQLEGV